MGSDNLFHKRRARRISSLTRQKPPIPRKAKYLIVCEGSVTEPNYFRGLRNFERLSTAYMAIFGEECGSDPVSVVEFAAHQYQAEKLDPFDEVFCVIDRDGHSNFKPAMSRVADLKKRGIPIELIISWPCFEYWVLLHHRYSRNPYRPVRRASGCDAVISDIRRNHDRRYEKAQANIYAALKPLQLAALRHASLAQADAQATGEENPHTQVHTLVGKLLALNVNQ